MFTAEVLKSIEDSVLCWLATSSADNIPNVSPKEIFAAIERDTIVIANIASPQSAANIRVNPNVCVSFIDILVQKGFQVKGMATLVKKDDAEFGDLAKPLLKQTAGRFPFATVFKIVAASFKPIVAPRYLLYPETTEGQQIASAIQTYRLENFPNPRNPGE